MQVYIPISSRSPKKSKNEVLVVSSLIFEYKLNLRVEKDFPEIEIESCNVAFMENILQIVVFKDCFSDFNIFYFGFGFNPLFFEADLINFQP